MSTTTENEKLDNSLKLALQLSPSEREESAYLNYGFETGTKSWQLIVKHTGSIKGLETSFPGTTVTELFNGYGIITTKEENIIPISNRPEIVYVEKPRRLYFNLENGRNSSCLAGVSENPLSTGVVSPSGYRLTGRGTLVGIIDSGIDFRHPAFISPDGSSRIAWLWNQSAEPDTTPDSSRTEISFGTQYDKEILTQALNGDTMIPDTETESAHGTSVAGIAAGNGRGSAGARYFGVAPESELIVVKLGRKAEDFSGTTEVMLGLDYVLKKAILLGRPIAVNLSFGTNDGAHDGNSLFERYIAQLNGIWKNTIITASGNEGDARHHSRLTLTNDPLQVDFSIGSGEKSLVLQLWKEYVDSFLLILKTPSGKEIFFGNTPDTARRYPAGNGEILYYYGTPTPFTTSQKILIEWLPERGQVIESGIWSLQFLPKNIVNGTVSMWFPTVEAIGASTGFFLSDPDTSLTIPSTAKNVISVGAYRTDTDAVASFSGRGNTADGRVKPTLVAPGVNIITTIPNGRYGEKTGTSIAAPFVTGSTALLMEWGIVQGNDPYLYGEKVKAYLMKGARKLPEQTAIPDTKAGYGALCVRNSFPVSSV